MAFSPQPVFTSISNSVSGRKSRGTEDGAVQQCLEGF